MAALIEDHGIIGDLHGAALVSTDGDIAWLCLPRFDSPSVFASLLDDERGGFTVRCRRGDVKWWQMYLPDSNVLVTRFLGEHFVGEVVDFMVPHERGSARRGTGQLVRLVHAVRGRVDVEIRCCAFDYARARTEVEVVEGSGAFFFSPLAQLVLRSTVPLTADGSAAVGRPVLEEGESLARWRCPAGARRDRWRWARSRSFSTRPCSTGSGGSATPVPGPVPGDGGAVGADPQAARLPAHRGLVAAPDVAAGGLGGTATGTTASPGSRTPRSPSTRGDAARLHRGG